jgi:hypothetical protein
MPRTAALTCTLMAQLATPAFADSVIASVQGERFSGIGTGYGEALSWQHASVGSGWALGLQQDNFPDGNLTVVNEDGHRATGERVTWSAGATEGGGRSDGENFSLFKLYGGIEVRCARQWWLQLRDQYVNAADVHGQLALGGATYDPNNQWQLHVEGGSTLSGNLGNRYVQFVVHHFASVHAFAGIVAGTQNYDETQFGLPPFERALRQAYGGVGIPIGHAELGWTGEWIDLGGSTRATLRLSITLPVGP